MSIPVVRWHHASCGLSRIKSCASRREILCASALQSKGKQPSDMDNGSIFFLYELDHSSSRSCNTALAGRAHGSLLQHEDKNDLRSESQRFGSCGLTCPWWTSRACSFIVNASYGLPVYMNV